MAYDDTARKLAVKIIGTVESDLNYSAVNYNDPITVGIAQWYGTRAASVLCRMRDDNPSSWHGVAASIANQLATISKDDSFWNMRYLTQAEGNSLTGVMSRNQEIQNMQLQDDLIPYEATAINYGFDPDTNTQTVLYFFSMHHQSPQSALEVVRTLDSESTLDDIHKATLAHPVLGQYGTRYRTTYELIKTGNVDGVDVPPAETPEPETPPNGNTKYVESRGDLLIVNFADGEQLICYSMGVNRWAPRQSKAAPSPETPVQPGPPPSNGGNGGWTHPLPGSTITSPYGMREGGFHYGVDLSTGIGSGSGRPVVAPTDMVITRVVVRGGANDGSLGTGGNYVKGYSVDGAYSFSFYHMSDGSLSVKEGQQVAVGTKLGIEGSTGNVSGMHLHFEVTEGKHEDPWTPPYGNPTEPLAVLRAHGVNI